MRGEGLRRRGLRPGGLARRALRLRDDRAQMMLLTAFVLVIGFVALSGMVARVTQLPEETRQSVDRPIYTESEAVARGARDMLVRLDALNAVDEDNMAGYPEHLRGLAEDGAKHLERLESARGFRLNFEEDPSGQVMVCDVVDADGDGSADDVVIRTTFALSDIQTRIEFTIAFQIPDAADGTAAPDGNPTKYGDCAGNPAP